MAMINLTVLFRRKILLIPVLFSLVLTLENRGFCADLEDKLAIRAIVLAALPEEFNSSQQISDLYILGKIFYKDGKYEQAIQQWTEILRLDPSNSLAAQSIYIAQQRLSDQEANVQEKALARFDRILPLERANDPAFQDLGISRVSVLALIEQYSTGGMNDAFEKDTQSAVNSLGLVYENAEGKTTTTKGFGGRLGIFQEGVGNLNYGMSLGYIKGPKITQTIFASDPFFTSSTIENKMETSYLRLLAEAGKELPITTSIAIKIFGGAGLARGRIKQSSMASGSVVSDLGLPALMNSSEDWAGFTWEISPSIMFKTQRSSLEIGIKYAEFPTLKGDSNSPKISWKPLILFAGVSF